MTICERLFQLMNKKNIKAVQIAEKLNISQSVISNWRKRKTNPPIEYAIDICEVLDVSIYELLGAEEKNEIEIIYNRLSPDDKAIVDIIFNKYKKVNDQEPKQDQKSSDLKIG